VTIQVGRWKVDPLIPVGIAIFILGWMAASQLYGELKVPAPATVFATFVSSLTQQPLLAMQGGGNDGFAPHLTYTVERTLSGATVGALLGIVVGLAMTWSRRLQYLLDLPLEAIRTIPPLALIPFFVLWFGPSPVAEFGVLTLYSFLMMVVTTIEAARTVPAIYSQFALTLGADRRRIFRTVILPAMLPSMVGGIRVAVGTAWGIEIVAELIGAPRGMGQVFSMLMSLQALDVIMAGILWVTVVALIIDLIILACARYLTRWA